MARIVNATILALAAGATIVALLTTLSLLAPGLSQRTAHVLERMSGRSFLLGSVNFLFFFAIAAVLAQIGDSLGGPVGDLSTILALLISLFILSLATLGLVGMVLLLGQRIGVGAPDTVGRTIRAGILLVAAGLAPVVGWFVLTPLALLTALGATIIALAQRAGETLASNNDS